MSQCTAKSKRSGERCKKAPMLGRATCYYHGGTHPVGALAPQTKDGRYSRVLPARLLERYEESQRDRDLLALHQEISVVDSLLAEALKRLDATDSSQLWSEAISAYRAMTVAQRAKDTQAMRVALVELGDILERGQGDRANRDEAVKLIAARKSLVESERKRHIEMKEMVSSEQAMTLAHALVSSVKAHVTDQTALRAISADFVRLLNG